MTTIRRWRPFSDVTPFMGYPFNALFDFEQRNADSSEAAQLGIDVVKNEDGYKVLASLPGVSVDDIDVTIDNGLLKIQGTVKEEETSNGSAYVVRERRSGSYYRAIRLPENIDTDNATTEYRDGVISIELPAPATSKSKRLTVKTG